MSQNKHMLYFDEQEFGSFSGKLVSSALTFSDRIYCVSASALTFLDLVLVLVH